MDTFFRIIGTLIFGLGPVFFFLAIISLAASLILGFDVSVFTIIKIVVASYILLIVSLLVFFLIAGVFGLAIDKVIKKGK